MQQADLAHALRQRQYAYGLVPPALIETIADEAIIESYITCSSCGEKQVTPQQLQVAIGLATDAESFFTICDQLGRQHSGKDAL